MAETGPQKLADKIKMWARQMVFGVAPSPATAETPSTEETGIRAWFADVAVAVGAPAILAIVLVALAPAFGVNVVANDVLLAVAWVLGVGLTFIVSPRRKLANAHRVVFAAVSLVAYLAAGYVLNTHFEKPLSRQEAEEAAEKGAELGIEKERPPPASLVALVGSCELASLPVEIPAGGRVNLLPTNANYIKSNKYGIYSVPNDTDKTVQFPNAKTVKSMSKLFPSPLAAWKCAFANHGSANLAVVSIPMRVDFMSGPGPAKELPFAAMVGPIDAGASAAFYVVNDCPAQSVTILPDAAKVIIAGQTAPTTVPLQRPYRNPIEQITILFPSAKEWLGVTKC